MTGSAAARAAAWAHFEGLRLLMRATGVPGLISRAVFAPGTGPGGPKYHNSTVPGLEGYTWNGDASSDEICGHLFAYPLLARLAAPDAPADADAANEVLRNLTRHIVTHGYRLVDVTGQPTRWGHWEPALINGDRAWSDERGLNSMQMLGLLAASLVATPEPADPDRVLFAAAWADLVAAPNGYARNLLNLKIEAPSDVDVSDDELTMLATFGYLFAGAGGGMTPAERAAGNASLARTWAVLRRQRSSLWNALAVGAGQPADDPEVGADTLWSLRTWPLEAVDWPTLNSHRLDVRVDPDVQRDFRHGGDSVAVLPPNERSQGRWNTNPCDLDGGTGGVEGEPGAFLAGYWAARWAGLLAAPATA